MKRLALVATVLVLAACEKKDAAPADNAAATTPAMAPAAADAMKAGDSLAAKVDTAVKKMDSAATKVMDAGKGAMDAGKKAVDAMKKP